jgi:acyl-coenzyme A thioesterase PaaI-like protein
MNFPFDVIAAEEYERLRTVYEPLTQSMRRLIEAGISTGVDEAAIKEARRAIDAATATLERQPWATTSTLRHADTGRPLAWANPAVGLRNAIAPPMEIVHVADGTCWAEFTLGPAYEGPPGLVHGGICALVLDHLLGEVASEGLTKPLFTGTITLRYLRGTPLGPVRADAFVERTEGIKTYARGYLSDADGHTVEADGVFIRPAWARDEVSAP